MNKEGKTYKKIVSATGLFGGVQMINMLCSLIRAKVIALLIGAEGVGVIGLYNGAVEMISALTGMGLRQSGVRDVAKAKKEGSNALKRVVGIIRKLSLVLGLFGAVVFIGAAPMLSKFVFGSDKYLWGFVILSATLLFNALASGEQAILQGSDKLKVFARSTVAGSIASLVVSLPLYYCFGMGGIVPSLVAASAFTALFNYIASRRSRVESKKTGVKLAFKEGSPMLALGVFMTISGFITTLLNYVLIAWMNRYSSTAEVGFYQAGFTIVTRYVGLIFAAMATEYYPRLSAVHEDDREVATQVSRQMESSLLMLLPIIVIFMLLQHWIIELLYSSEFIVVTSYTGWAMPGVLLKAISWSLGFVLLAKGNGKLFLITELISDVTSLVINILLYYYVGLEGLGIAYTVNFAIYALYMWVLCASIYNFIPERKMLIVSVVVFLLVGLQTIVVNFMNLSTLSTLSLSIVITIASVIYSFFTLRRRVA